MKKFQITFEVEEYHASITVTANKIEIVKQSKNSWSGSSIKADGMLIELDGAIVRILEDVDDDNGLDPAGGRGLHSHE